MRKILKCLILLTLMTGSVVFAISDLEKLQQQEDAAYKAYVEARNLYQNRSTLENRANLLDKEADYLRVQLQLAREEERAEQLRRRKETLAPDHPINRPRNPNDPKSAYDAFLQQVKKESELEKARAEVAKSRSAAAIDRLHRLESEVHEARANYRAYRNLLSDTGLGILDSKITHFLRKIRRFKK